MKKIITIAWIILYTGCTLITKTFSQEKQSGLIIIDYEAIHRRNGELLLLNNDQEIIGRFTPDSIVVLEKKYEIDKLKRNVFNEHFNSLSYYPDYYIIVLKGYKIGKDRFEINVDGKTAFIESKYASFQSNEEYIRDKSVSLTKKTELKKEMDDNSETISNYLYYSYIVLEVNGDWLKVKCNKEVFGLDFVGYVRWKINDEIAVKVLYSY